MRQILLKSISVELDGRVCYITVSFLGSTEGKIFPLTPPPSEISPFRRQAFKSRLEWALQPRGREAPQQGGRSAVDIIAGLPSTQQTPSQ